MYCSFFLMLGMITSRARWLRADKLGTQLVQTSKRITDRGTEQKLSGTFCGNFDCFWIQFWEADE